MIEKGQKILESRPVSTGMFLFGLILFGAISYVKNPISLFPNTTYPGLTVSIEYPGADVKDLEEMITIPIEESISGVGGIEEIYSFTERGKTEINVEFEKESNLEFKSLEVRERIDIVAGNFPREVHKPFIYSYDPDNRPTMILTLKSETFDFIELRTIADNEVKRYLENIEGISKISVTGGKVREVLVSCDMQKLRAYGLDLSEIQRSIRENNTTSAVANLKKQGLSSKLLLLGRYKDLNDLKTLPVFSTKEGRNILLEDLANVSFSYREEESSSRLNGKENVSLYIYKSSLGNTLSISKEIHRKLDDLKISGVNFKLIYDQSETVKKSYLNLIACGGVGLILFFLLLYYHRNYKQVRIRTTLLTQTILNFFLFQFVLYIFKLDFDIIIFSAFILGFAIWTLVSFLLLEKTPQDLSNLKQVSTLPEFSALISIVLFLSLPLYFLDREIGEASFKLGVFIVLFLVFSYFSFSPIKRFFNQIRNRYFPSFISEPLQLELKFSLFQGLEPKITRKTILLIYVVVLLASIYRVVKIDKEFYYTIENKKILGYVELPSGTGFGFTNSITKRIEEKILALSEIEEVTSKVEGGHSFLIITLKDSAIAGDTFLEKMKKQVGNTSPAFVYFSRESDASKFKEIVVDVLGEDTEKLDETVKLLAEKARKIPGVEEVILRYKPPRDELSLVLDKYKTSHSNLSNLEIGTYLKLAIQGAVVSKFIEDSKEIDIRVRLSEEYRNSEKSLENYFIKNSTGKYAPLTEISSPKESKSPIKIFRKNKKRVLSFAIRTGKISHSKILSDLKSLGEELPDGYHLELGRSLEKTVETESKIYIVIGFAILFLFGILSSYFESFILALKALVKLSLPSSISFLFLSYVFGAFTLSMYLGILILLSISSFLIIVSHKMEETKSLKSIFYAFLPVVCLFISEVLFASEGGKFLKEIEITILVGFFVFAALLPFINPKPKNNTTE